MRKKKTGPRAKPNVLYMMISNDKYELPVAIGTTVAELSEATGRSKNTILSSLSHGKHGVPTRFLKVEWELEDDDEEW